MTEETQGNVSFSTFVLEGFPELSEHRRLLAPPVLLIYLLLLAGNWLLLTVIRNTPRLHSPMYALVSALALVNILVPTAIMPTLLPALFSPTRISLAACLSQMFFTHFLSSVESSVLLAMALDRFVSVCEPLRYGRIMTAHTLLALLMLALVRSGAVMAALVALASRLSYCRSDVIPHCYCDHMALVSLACGSLAQSRAAGVVVIVCFVGVDISLILSSYVRILWVVLRGVGGARRRKAFHTCGTHAMVMMCFYLVGSVTFLSRNLNIPIPVGANSVLGVAYIVFPASVNPVIYGVRTKEIRNALVKMFRRRASRVSAVGGRGPVG